MVDSVVEKGLRHLCEDTAETVGSVCGWVHVWEWGGGVRYKQHDRESTAAV